MCFSAEISIITFIVGIIGSLLCISLGKPVDKILGYFFIFVSLMQGIEYLLWNHQKCDNYNRFLSILGMVLNHLQPIVLGLLILYFNKNVSTKIMYIIMFLYLCAIIPYSIQFLNNKNLECTIKTTKNKHLLWNWNSMFFSNIIYPIFLLTLCLLIYFGLNRYKFIAILVALISFGTSYFFYYKEGVMGSLWCFYILFITYIYYILNLLVI
jgi:hypothetical protein